MTAGEEEEEEDALLAGVDATTPVDFFVERGVGVGAIVAVAVVARGVAVVAGCLVGCLAGVGCVGALMEGVGMAAVATLVAAVCVAAIGVGAPVVVSDMMLIEFSSTVAALPFAPFNTPSMERRFCACDVRLCEGDLPIVFDEDGVAILVVVDPCAGVAMVDALCCACVAGVLGAGRSGGGGDECGAGDGATATLTDGGSSDKGMAISLF